MINLYTFCPFSYLADRKILDGISLVVPAGKSVAIVGTSGSGKVQHEGLLEFLQFSSFSLIILLPESYQLNFEMEEFSCGIVIVMFTSDPMIGRVISGMYASSPCGVVSNMFCLFICTCISVHSYLFGVNSVAGNTKSSPLTERIQEGIERETHICTILKMVTNTNCLESRCYIL